MHKIGHVIRVAGKSVVVRCDGSTPLREGMPVYLSEGKKLGNVIEYFGPVGRPYLRIKTRESVEVGSPVFMEEK